MSLNRLSVELIPRNSVSIKRDDKLTHALFPIADTINIPDLTRFSLRSWQAAQEITYAQHVIPHIRAIDIAPHKPLPCSGTSIKEVLIIHGDPPSDLSQQTYPNSSESIIRRYRKELPNIKIYAAFDPYRRALWEEMEAVKRKKDAGASGFFTQPFFDFHLFEFCYELLREEEIFWGISPVIGERSKCYWETTNHVIFPRTFETTLDANIYFAQQLLKRLAAEGDNAYLMPVKVKLEDYLSPLMETLQHT